MTTNKNHWYDGRFYDIIIAPNQDRLFGQIINLIEKDKDIIDVGTGTGRFPFQAVDKCKSVLGIDLSKRNINTANLRLSKNHDERISFKHTSLEEISDAKRHFDYAVITYVIHEVNENDRIKLLNDIALIADKIIIGDYLVPKQKGFWSFINEVVEFAAGLEHYRNYKNYTANGGINYLAEKAGLKIVTEIKNHPATSHLVVLEKNNNVPQ